MKFEKIWSGRSFSALTQQNRSELALVWANKGVWFESLIAIGKWY